VTRYFISFFFLAALTFGIVMRTAAQNGTTALEAVDSLLSAPASANDEADNVPQLSFEDIIRNTQDHTMRVNSINRVLLRQLDTTYIMEVLPMAEAVVEVVEKRLTSAGSRINLMYISALVNLLESVQGQTSRVEHSLSSHADA
jgi:hypothetical protein